MSEIKNYFKCTYTYFHKYIYSATLKRIKFLADKVLSVWCYNYFLDQLKVRKQFEKILNNVYSNFDTYIYSSLKNNNCKNTKILFK